MAIRTILVPTWAHADAAPQLAAAYLVAERLGAHIQVLFVQLDPKTALMNLPELIGGGIDFARIERDSDVAAGQAREQFDLWCARLGLAALPADFPQTQPSAAWLEEVGDFDQLVEEHGRLSDLIVIANSDSHEMLGGRAFQPALFGTGRPTLIVDNAAGSLLDHVLIAWNGSLEASNAVGQSTDLLRAAGRVSVYSEGSSPEAVSALLAYLRRHGVRCDGEHAPVSASSTGASILATAEAAGVTLLVRGAYTQSRLRQAILGGTTRHLLSHAGIPIVMAH
ncbi:MAG: universal stress protein [Aliidongia sp.]|jgi:nucleotide-binding universal stress UspA family protein